MTCGRSSARTRCGCCRAGADHQPPPPPPPPPPPDEPPPPEPPPLDPGGLAADAIDCDSAPPRWLAKPTGSFDQFWLPEYQVEAAAPAPAAASTLANRDAQRFSTSSAIA